MRNCIATIEVVITLLVPAKVTNIDYKNIPQQDLVPELKCLLKVKEDLS